MAAAGLPAHQKECTMANWQWIIFWVLVAAPFVLSLRRVLRTRRGGHRPLCDKGGPSPGAASAARPAVSMATRSPVTPPEPLTACATVGSSAAPTAAPIWRLVLIMPP